MQRADRADSATGGPASPDNVTETIASRRGLLAIAVAAPFLTAAVRPVATDRFAVWRDRWRVASAAYTKTNDLILEQRLCQEMVAAQDFLIGHPAASIEEARTKLRFCLDMKADAMPLSREDAADMMADLARFFL